MRKFVAGLMTAAMTVSLFGPVYAAKLSDIHVGDRYYIYRLVGENEVVEVIDVAQTNGSVQVRHTNGSTSRVRPEDLLNRLESKGADAVTDLALAAGFVALLYCGAYPKECKK